MTLAEKTTARQTVGSYTFCAHVVGRALPPVQWVTGRSARPTSVATAGRAAIFLAAVCLVGAGCGHNAGEIPSEQRLQAAPAADPAMIAVGEPSSVAKQAIRPDAAVSRWPPGRLDITFDDIKFDMRKGEPFARRMLTDRIEQLHGRAIRIRGYILPSFRQRGITEFVLVRDNLECCFGPGAALFDCIVVHMEAGRDVSYTVRPVTVEGTFAIEELTGVDGIHLAIFRITGRRVR